MLNIETDFPNAGSRAMLGQQAVRIIQRCGDRAAVVQGKGHTRTVSLDQLSPANPADPLAAWLDDRTITVPGSNGTPARELLNDFRAWLTARGITSDVDTGVSRFRDALEQLTVFSTPITVKGRTVITCNRALRAPVQA